MPYVNIKITREGATAEQKATLIREVTRLLAETLGKNPATTVVVIEEVRDRQLGHWRRNRHCPQGAGEERKVICAERRLKQSVSRSRSAIGPSTALPSVVPLTCACGTGAGRENKLYDNH